MKLCFLRKRIIIVFLLLATTSIIADNINVDKTYWKKKGLRSIVINYPPDVNFCGNKLCFYFYESISQVKFTLYDEVGDVYFEEIASVIEGELYTLPISLEENITYKFEVSHPSYGYIIGFCCYNERVVKDLLLFQLTKE